MQQREYAPLSGHYRYQQHETRNGLNYEKDLAQLEQRYAYFLEGLPYRREIETLIDPSIHGNENLPLHLGYNTAEILFNAQQIDPITSGHGESVAELAVMLAEELGADIPAYELYLGGRMHDIWKLMQADLLKQPDIYTLETQGSFVHDETPPYCLWVPRDGVKVQMLEDDIPFTQEQRERMRTHPVFGAAYLAALGYPDTVVEASAQHHAFFTFQGEAYPEIPTHKRSLAGAIYNTADFICGARARRPYKWDVPLQLVLSNISAVQEAGKIPSKFAEAFHRLVAKYDEPWMVHTIHTPCVLESFS